MASELPETNHFGFTRIGQGENLGKNGWSFTDLDRLKLDDLLYAALNHTHDGSPRLGDPTDPPTLAAVNSGGSLPAGTTYYYRVSFVDAYGLETASSPEASVTTPNPIAAPSAPAATVESTSGTISPGVYSYLITYVDAIGGETTPSGANNVQVMSGSTNRIRLDLPDLASGAVAYNVYRSRPGQTQFYYLGQIAAGPYYDTGVVEDHTITNPTTNSTNSTNAVQVTIPLNFIPEGCYSWKIYRATSSGDYDGSSLVHQVTEGYTDLDTTPRTMWQDSGDALQQGFPQNVSSTVPGGSILALSQIQGQIPYAATPRGGQTINAFLPGAVANNSTVTVTKVPGDIQPVRLTAYFQTDLAEASPTAVRVRVTDSATTPNYIELTCAKANNSGAAGYYATSWPLTASGSVEAETGTLNPPTTVVIASDLAAGNGQAVTLDTQNESVTVPLGVLDKGTYTGYFTARVLQYATLTYVAVPANVSATASETGGTLGANTYYYRVTALSSLGETTVSSQVQATIAGTTGSVALAWTASTNATGYKIYRGTVNGGSLANSLLATIPSGSTINYTDTGTALGPGTPPQSNTAAVPTDDLTVAFQRTDNNTNIVSKTYTMGAPAVYPSATTYVEYATPQFTAPGDVGINMIVTKSGSITQSYNLDRVRYAASLVTLKKGILTMTAYVDNGPTVAANANITLWF